MATRAPNAAEERGDGGRQRDLGHEQQHTAARLAHAARKAEVDLGLAAARDAVQERNLKRAARRQRAQPLQRRVLLRCQRHRRRGVGRHTRSKGSRSTRAVRPRRDPVDEAGDAPSIQPARRELGDGRAVRRAAQEIENGSLPGRQRRAGEIFCALRRDARDPHRARRVSSPAQRLCERDQSILLEREDASCTARSGRSRSRRRCCARPSARRGPRVARRAPEQARLAELRDPRVALALDPRPRRHRGGHRLAEAARVVFGHPMRQAHDVGWKERLIVQDVDDGLQIRRSLRLRSVQRPVEIDSNTMPVRTRVPSGTSARAPTGGSRRMSGTRYQSGSSEGTGTATRTRRMALLAGVLQERATPSSCPPRPRACSRDCAAETPDGTSGSASRRGSRRGGRAGARSDPTWKQRLGREGAERHDDPRRDGLDLAEQERLAGLDLVRLGVAVAGRTALDDVRDVDLVARKPIASMIFVSSCPARPTKGTPCTSSSPPGASPTNIKSAQGCRRRTRSGAGQRVQLAPRADHRCRRGWRRARHWTSAQSG